MIINGKQLLDKAPFKDMLDSKHRKHGVSYGLAEAGYDIRLKQQITFDGQRNLFSCYDPDEHHSDFVPMSHEGHFCIASAIDEFQMPEDLVGVVHDKSTWARKGLSVFNTVIEPGWKGFLTLELVYHGRDKLVLPAGSGIAQVLFTQVSLPASYNGKYQNQENRPVAAVFEPDTQMDMFK